MAAPPNGLQFLFLRNQDDDSQRSIQTQAFMTSGATSMFRSSAAPTLPSMSTFLGPHMLASTPVPAPLPAPKAVWNNMNPPQPRGRVPQGPKLPPPQDLTYYCGSIAELEDSLRDYLHAPYKPARPKHAECVLVLSSQASLVPTPRNNYTGHDEAAGPDLLPSLPKSVQELLEGGKNVKGTMGKQRTVSKMCVAAIQNVDGNRYSFHNNWKSRGDDAYRFSFYCNDSLLNKDRVANGEAGSEGKIPTKPVYDCGGGITIKFSATKGNLEIYYKHILCHPSHDERCPPIDLTIPLERSAPSKSVSASSKRGRPSSSSLEQRFASSPSPLAERQRPLGIATTPVANQLLKHNENSVHQVMATPNANKIARFSQQHSSVSINPANLNYLALNSAPSLTQAPYHDPSPDKLCTEKYGDEINQMQKILQEVQDELNRSRIKIGEQDLTIDNLRRDNRALLVAQNQRQNQIKVMHNHLMKLKVNPGSMVKNSKKTQSFHTNVVNHHQPSPPEWHSSAVFQSYQQSSTNHHLTYPPPSSPPAHPGRTRLLSLSLPLPSHDQLLWSIKQLSPSIPYAPRR